VTKNIKLSSGY